MKFKPFTSLCLTLFSLLFVACSMDVEVGSKQRPFRMYFVPSVDAEKLNRSGDTMSDFVSRYVSQKLYNKDEGFYVEASVPTSYVAVAEAFGTGKADFATFNTFSYILTKDIKKYPIEAILRVVRGKNESTYKSQFLAHVDSGIDSVDQLDGKKIAFTDPASTSGFILPTKILEKKGIKPGEVVFAQKHDNVVTMIYQNQVDAGATYYSPPKVTIENGKTVSKIMDARSRVLTQFPDVESKVKIIGFSEEIPNEPWVIRSNLLKDPTKNKELKEHVTQALLAFIETETGKLALDEIASGTGLIRSDDAVYKDIRETILAANIDVEAILSK